MHKTAEILLLGIETELEFKIQDATKRIGTLKQSIREYERCNELVNGVPNQIVLVGIDSDPERGFRAVSAMVSKHPQRPIIVVSESKDSNQVLKAMRAGARDYAILEPDLKDVIRATTELASERFGATLGTVVSVFSAKGGSGATTIATNLAGMLKQKRDLRVVLVDLNVEMGDASLFLDLSCRYTIADAIRNLQRLDSELLLEVIAKHSSGIHLLAQSDNVDDAANVTPENVTMLIDFLRRQYDVVVLEGLRGFDNMSLTALDASDQILLVLTQDVPSIKNARRCLKIFGRLGYEDDRLQIVLNRYRKNHEIDPIAVYEAVGRHISGSVANDFPTVMEAINKGLLLEESAPRARVTENIGDLVTLIAGQQDDVAPEKKNVFAGLFSRRR
jgi:pilus assembly protein CpaE